MIVAFAFFSLVFTTAVWLIYAGVYVFDAVRRTVGTPELADIAVYAAFVLLPVLAVWVVFGLINQYLVSRNFNGNLYLLFKQMKKNQDYTDLVSRILLETEQQIKDGFILNRFDLLVQDMNELLAEIIYRSSIASPEQIERLWGRVQNGGKWAFAKVLIEVNQNQPNFKLRVFDRARKDNVLAGSILEFAARYQGLLGILEKHDKERMFINIIETGVFGKVFSIMAPLADEIKRSREISSSFSERADAYIDDDVESGYAVAPEPRYQPEPAAVKSSARPAKPSFVSKINVFKKKPAPAVKAEPVVGLGGGEEERDPFSIALERSFGTPAEDDGPHFEIAQPEPEEETPAAVTEAAVSENIPPAAAEAEEDEILTDTQKKLNDLKKEWADMKKPAAAVTAIAVGDDLAAAEKTEETEALAYPFGGWTDEENYNR